MGHDEIQDNTGISVDSERLQRFVDSKTRAALDADMPPYRTVVEDASTSLIQIGNHWTRGLFDGPFYLSPIPARVPGASLVFVQSRDGNTGVDNPSSLGGGETDKHLIYEGLSRVAADAVMAGAGTIRTAEVIFSVWHPELVSLRRALGKPRHPVQIVATLRGIDLDRGLLFNTPDARVVIITIASCAPLMRPRMKSRPWITLIATERPAQLQSALIALRHEGIERISVVGGRTLATQLLDAGLIQDVYLTTSPRTGGEPDTPLYAGQLGGRLVVRKQGTGKEAGVLFDHLNVTS
jgi:riboflavin biosynthesis pyrimidine reductase